MVRELESLHVETEREKKKKKFEPKWRHGTNIAPSPAGLFIRKRYWVLNRPTLTCQLQWCLLFNSHPFLFSSFMILGYVCRSSEQGNQHTYGHTCEGYLRIVVWIIKHWCPCSTCHWLDTITQCSVLSVSVTCDYGSHVVTWDPHLELPLTLGGLLAEPTDLISQDRKRGKLKKKTCDPHYHIQVMVLSYTPDPELRLYLTKNKKKKRYLLRLVINPNKFIKCS